MALYAVVEAASAVTSILKLDLTTTMTTQTVLAQHEVNVSGIETDGVDVYWSTPGSLRKVPVGGGTVQSFGIPNMSACGGMDIDSTYLYCTENSTGSVLQIPLADTAAHTVVTTATIMTGIAADCDFVYFGLGTGLNRLPRL